MCGIAGMITPGGRAEVRPLLAALANRGPDGMAEVVSGAAAIGATRLAVRDAAGGGQPMQDPATGIVLAFNGEIYNDGALRAALAARGHRFRTRCDTETVLRGWIEWGPDVLPRLDGMFALAVAHGTRLTLARDRFGIKPLFHVSLGRDGPFLFASEIPALLRMPQVPRRLNLRAFADFTAVGYPTGTDSFFEDIACLEPGHRLTLDWAHGLRTEIARFADAEAAEPETAGADPARDFGDALEAAVETHLAADRLPAVALSGGIDSSLLAFLAAAKAGRAPVCYTVADADTHPDVVAARRVAKAIGAEHHVLVQDFGSYLRSIPATLQALAAPDLGPGPSFLALSRAIGSRHKVALNGEGADETLGGYADFLDAAGTLQRLRDGFSRAAAVGLSPSPRAVEIRDRLQAVAADPMAFRRSLREIYFREQLVRCHLEPVDHLSMAASTEMRVPFLDRGVQRFGAAASRAGEAAMTLGVSKRALRRFALARFGEAMLDIALRPKLQMPEAARRHERRFAALAAQCVSDAALRASPLAAAFPDKAAFLTFEIFRRLHLTRELSPEADLAGILPDLVQPQAVA